MAETDGWLTAYADTRRDTRLPALYWLALPALLVGLPGLLWSLPVPETLSRLSPLLNWGSVFLMAALVYYFIISVPLALGMLPLTGALLAIEEWLARSLVYPETAALSLTAGGLVCLYAGHARGGGWPSFLRELQLVMLAPLWLLSRAYSRLGIPL